jgi:hypothetical protein
VVTNWCFPASYDEQCYTTLAPHMYTAWKAVEDESGVELVHKTGALVFGPKSGTEVDKVRSCSLVHRPTKGPRLHVHTDL